MAKPDDVGDSAFHKRVRRQVAGRIRPYYAITMPGCEDLCRRELVDLGIDATGMAVEPGGVAFSSRLVDCQRANLHLRTATRILMRIAAFSATNVRRLEKKAEAIAWELFLPPGPLPDVKVTSHQSRLFHTEAIAQILRGGIARRLGGPGPQPPSHVPQSLFVRVVQDRFTLSLDASGAPLYKRGLKAGAARAPIRETQAAAILMRAGYDPRRPLVDPLCGSGTFSLEAAMLAKWIAPGLWRDFAFMGWPSFRENQWAFLKREAQMQTKAVVEPLIFASDLDPDTCKQLAAAVTANGLSDAIRVAQKDIFQSSGEMFGSRPGLVVINPPYGIRMGSSGQADLFFKDICRHLTRRFRGWKIALIAPRRDLVRRLPFAAERFPLLHGGLKLTLLIGTISVAA
jgi:putative N6-adenine-specific DNA methylase